MPLSYQDRLSHCEHPLTRHILQTILRKQSNLCVSADVSTAAELLALVDAVGPEVCMVKTHIDCISDFTLDMTKTLRALAQKHDCVVFEDRKFADIGATVQSQYGGGIYHIADWADLINAHPLPGAGMVRGLQQVALRAADAGHSEGAPIRGLLLIAQMSAKGHLMDQRYIDASLQMAKDHADFVMGFITTHAITDDPRFLHMTPGVRDDAEGDALGQQYVSPHEAIVTRGTDIIIVGRGITSQADPRAAAKRYRALGWEAAAGRS